MKGKRGEITVFLSLITVLCLSLFLALLESARTTGARLYLEMAANSSMSSVMSQYNRNLWDMYHLLFLECESEAAVKQSFDAYLSFYTERENLYPMKRMNTEILNVGYMSDSGGKLLEKEILNYMKYQLPDMAADMDVVEEAAKEASKADDFKILFEVCRDVGSKTRKLEKSRKRVEQCLEDLPENKETFSELLQAYEREVNKLSEYRKELQQRRIDSPDNADAAARMNREIDAFIQVEDAAIEQLRQFEEIELQIEEGLDEVEKTVIDQGNDESGQKSTALDRLELLFTDGLLSLVLSDETIMSERCVSLRGIPSKKTSPESVTPDPVYEAAFYHFMVNEYCLIHFDSFLEEKNKVLGQAEQPLLYEMEYLIGGNDTDRKNLAEVVMRLLFMRAAMNLCYLTQTPECNMEADRFAAAVSGGNIPLQVITSFFIQALWAMAEAVLDVRSILSGGNVPFRKTGETWRLNLDQVFSLEFLGWNMRDDEAEGSWGYEEYLRILCFLLDREEKNGRIMDLIQWNVGVRQKDFAVEDCVGMLEIQTEMKHRHVFFTKEEYKQEVTVVGDY